MKQKNVFIKKMKSIPWYGWFFGISIIFIQMLFHFIAWVFAERFSSSYFLWIPNTELDKYIPLCPYFFIEMYDLWFVAVPIGGIIAGLRDKKSWINFTLSWLMAIFLGFVIYMIAPSAIDRTNVQGVPGGNIIEYVKTQKGFSWWLLSIMISNTTKSYCAFPSFHCLQIIFCYIGVARNKKIHLAWRLTQLFITISICLSTFFLKQHYIIDLLMSFLLCLITYMIINSFDVGQAILKKCPNFLIIKKLNWTNEKIISISKDKKKIEK